MIYITDLQNIVQQWLNRLGDSSQPIAYRDALNECIYDINSLKDKTINETLDYTDIIESIEADNYISSSEAHEAVA